MKFYNPFKWHIVEINGMYFVRRFSIFWWEYADFTCRYNWTSNSKFFEDCLHETEEKARLTLAKRQMKARYIG